MAAARVSILAKGISRVPAMYSVLRTADLAWMEGPRRDHCPKMEPTDQLDTWTLWKLYGEVLGRK